MLLKYSLAGEWIIKEKLQVQSICQESCVLLKIIIKLPKTVLRQVLMQ